MVRLYAPFITEATPQVTMALRSERAMVRLRQNYRGFIAGQCAGQAGAAPRRRAHQILPSRRLWRGHFAPRDPTGVYNRLSRRALLMSDLEPEVPPPCGFAMV